MGTGVFETYSLQPGGRAADIPGGPGTSASLNLDLPFASVFETASDIDWFRFEAEAGATYRFEIDGDPASSDPVEDQGLALYASDGTLLVEKDRRPNLDYPGRLPGPTSITYAPEADGPLFIGAQAAGAAGGYALSATRTDDIPDNASTRETLAVGGTVYGVSSPVYDEDWYPVALEGGRTYVFTLDGDDVATDPLHPWLQLYADDGALIDAAAFEALAFGPTAEPLAGLTYRPKDDETVFVSAAGTPVLDASGAASQDYVGTYALRVGLSDDILDNAETEGRIAVGETVKGRADYPWDEDWYLMAAKKGTVYEIEVTANPETVADSSDYYFAAGWSGIDFFGGEAGGSWGRASATLESRADSMVAITAGSYNAAVDYLLTVTTLEDDAPSSVDTPRTLAVGGALRGEIEYYGDDDWFRADLLANGRFVIKVTPDAYSFGIILRDATGEPIDEVFDYQAGPKQIAYETDTTETVFVEVRGTSYNTPVGYRVELSAETDTFFHDGHYYRAGTPGLSWSAARAEAKAAGGRLVVIDDAAENAFVTETFWDGKPIWLGIADGLTEGVFRAVDRGYAPIGYANWLPGQPDDTGCGHLRARGQDRAAIASADGRWDDSFGSTACLWANGRATWGVAADSVIEFDAPPPPALDVLV